MIDATILWAEAGNIAALGIMLGGGGIAVWGFGKCMKYLAEAVINEEDFRWTMAKAGWRIVKTGLFSEKYERIPVQSH